MEYAVDMQGFLQPGKDFVVKELAILSLHDDNSDSKVFMFQAPYPWIRLSNKYRKINLSLEFDKHGLSWDSGKIPYTEVGNVLKENLSDAKKIYVKGDLRKKWLERFNLPVYEVTAMDYSQKPTRVATICLNHNPQRHIKCALYNVRVMKKIILENLEWEDMDWEDI